jgi:hypothetical protein
MRRSCGIELDAYRRTMVAPLHHPELSLNAISAPSAESPLVEAADRQALKRGQLVATDAAETRQHDQAETVLRDSATPPGLVETW